VRGGGARPRRGRAGRRQGLDEVVGAAPRVPRLRRRHSHWDVGEGGDAPGRANVRPDLFVALRDGGGAEVQDEVGRLRSQLPFARLKAALAERLAGYPTAYRAPLG